MRVNAEERREAELWRVDKIRKLALIDPSYPGSYALGIAYYRAGRYDLAADAFTAFISAHPDGPYALRAKNHLKAALAAHGAL
jgi:TolA-binding protein